jgi:acyl-coenzyme A synthetase/AMP-(fatty) acid ligase
MVAELSLGLVELGVRPGDRVAIAARNSDIFLHYIYAVARIGAVGLDPSVSVPPILTLNHRRVLTRRHAGFGTS